MVDKPAIDLIVTRINLVPGVRATVHYQLVREGMLLGKGSSAIPADVADTWGAAELARVAQSALRTRLLGGEDEQAEGVAVDEAQLPLSALLRNVPEKPL